MSEQDVTRNPLPFETGKIHTPAGPVPKVPADLVSNDRWGTFKARWGVGRMDYSIPPGLYAVGNPDDRSTVLVTANYKMSFDKLREQLPERDAWILVLDTDGINVWCAAGKGTFGTDELVRRIEATRLAEVVSHKKLILPQLGAPGVSAQAVKRQAGFRVIYGPVRAVDLPAFLDAGLKATPEMRRVTFTFTERAVLIPIELVDVLKITLLLAPLFFFLSGLGGPNDYWTEVMNAGLFAVIALFGATVGASVFVPLLLPWLPGRAFSIKGLIVGLVVAVIIVVSWQGGLPQTLAGRMEAGGWVLLGSALSAFTAMNFTGASTYTSLSGVRREMRVAVPLQIVGAVVGLVLWIGSRIVP
jgi:acetyl-CoA decarbonylase/synthase complex subunit gamma